MFGERFLIRVIDWIVALIVVLLGLRIILRLTSANPTTPFVNWIYTTTAPLLAPFEGIFPTTAIDPGNILEFSALFALVIYVLLGFLLERLVATVALGVKETVDDNEE